MATKDNQSSPDESLDPADELQLELAKTKQALLVAAAMQQTEAQLASTLPTQPAPVQPPPTGPTGGRWMPTSGVAPAAQPGVSDGVAPVEAPTMPVSSTPPMLNRGGIQSVGSPLVAPPSAPQGRSYMGPAMSPEQEAEFMRSPAGTNINLTPGMTPEKWAATTQEGVTRAPPPEMLANMKRYEAQKSIQKAVADGTPMRDAIQLYGEGLFPSLNTATRPMTEYQGKNLELRTQQLSQSDARTKEYQRLAQENLNNKLTPQTALESKSLYSQKAMLQGQIASPNTNPKKVPGLQSDLEKVNARIKELFPAKSPVQAPASAATTKSSGTLTRSKAQEFLSQAKGDKAKARQLARDAGYEL